MSDEITTEVRRVPQSTLASPPLPRQIGRKIELGYSHDLAVAVAISVRSTLDSALHAITLKYYSVICLK